MTTDIDTPRLFVASDERMGRAERVLEYSVRKHASGPVAIYWMRAGDPSWYGETEWHDADWTGMPREPYPRERNDGAVLWATRFTNFRFCIPPLCRFDGFAIYMDVDVLVRHDIFDLWNQRKTGKWAMAGASTCVSVIDCHAMRGLLPEIAEQRRSTKLIDEWAAPLPLHPNLDHAWNVIDAWDQRAKCLHYSQMATQPWRPWPERFDYGRRHPAPTAVQEWHRYEDEMIARDGAPAARPET